VGGFPPAPPAKTNGGTDRRATQWRHQRRAQDASAADSAEELGAVPTIETPEKFAAFIAAEMRRWSEDRDRRRVKVD
jgi:hypothetical protein